MFFDPNDTGTQTTETKVEEKKVEEVKKSTKKISIDGEVIELTEEQQERAMALGVQKAKELAAEKEKKEKETKEEPKTPENINKITEQRLEKLEQQLAEANEEKRLALLQGRIEGALSKSGIDPDFTEDVQHTIINNYSIALKMQEKTGQAPDLSKICEDAIGKFKKKMEKYDRKIDPDKKREDREKTKGLASGNKTPSQEAEKPMNRFSFRNGEMRKRIAERVKGFLTDD